MDQFHWMNVPSLDDIAMWLAPLRHAGTRCRW